MKDWVIELMAFMGMIALGLSFFCLMLIIMLIGELF